MQDDPRYDDVVDGRSARSSPPGIDAAMRAGIAGRSRSSIPASASARPPTTTSSCCARLGELRELGRPIVLGTSRKSFLGRITGREVDDRVGDGRDRVLALAAGADVLRSTTSPRSATRS